MSMRVLIADPDWRFANQATSYMEAHAHLVVHHTSDTEAIETARSWSPDVVIVSEELTENGLLEELDTLADRPAVLLIGWMDRCNKVWKAWQKGGDELLMKPVFRAEELHAAVMAAMRNSTAGHRYNRVTAVSA